TYNTRDSLVVTDPTTSLAISGLSRAERTGCRIFHYLWSYVTGWAGRVILEGVRIDSIFLCGLGTPEFQQGSVVWLDGEGC
ncbi:hypothetical protein B0T17DRAFT_486290, partial [Bombardia bombarda]